MPEQPEITDIPENEALPTKVEQIALSDAAYFKWVDEISTILCDRDGEEAEKLRFDIQQGEYRNADLFKRQNLIQQAKTFP